MTISIWDFPVPISTTPAI